MAQRHESLERWVLGWAVQGWWAQQVTGVVILDDKAHGGKGGEVAVRNGAEAWTSDSEAW